MQITIPRSTFAGEFDRPTTQEKEGGHQSRRKGPFGKAQTRCSTCIVLPLSQSVQMQRRLSYPVQFACRSHTQKPQAKLTLSQQSIFKASFEGHTISPCENVFLPEGPELTESTLLSLPPPLISMTATVPPFPPSSSLAL